MAARASAEVQILQPGEIPHRMREKLSVKTVVASASISSVLSLTLQALAQTSPPAAEVTVDAAQGPVTGSTRVIGLGGAYVAVAEGMDGIAVNPASVAVRLPYSWNRWDY